MPPARPRLIALLTAALCCAAPARPAVLRAAPAESVETVESAAGFVSASDLEEELQALEEEEDLPLVDAAREGVREAVEWVARGVDGWFGDIPFEEGGRVSKGRIRIKTVWREGENLDLHVRFRVSMRLPNLRDRVYVLIGSDNEEDLVRDRSDTLREHKRMVRESRKSDETMFTGLGIRLTDDLNLRLTLRDLYKPMVKLRFEHQWTLGPRDRLTFQETGFWALDDGFGETTIIDFEHDITDTLMLRWSNNGTCSEEDDGLDWFSSLSLIKQFPRLRQLSGEALIDGETGGDVDIKEYGFNVKWRQPVYKDWLFGEISTGYYWEKERRGGHREGELVFGVGVQMDF